MGAVSLEIQLVFLCPPCDVPLVVLHKFFTEEYIIYNLDLLVILISAKTAMVTCVACIRLMCLEVCDKSYQNILKPAINNSDYIAF